MGIADAGHPERGHTPGVETTTGPLGQGVANAVGMAIAERFLAEHFNRQGRRIVDHRVWAFASDGDLMEGVASESASLAGHLRLGKLTVVYDDNHITIDGDTALTFSEDVQRRFEAYGWHVVRVGDGNDLAGIAAALEAARAESGRPTLVILRTYIADPAPTKRNSAEAHGAPLGADEVRRTKEIMGWPTEPAFHVPEDALAHWRGALERGEALEAEWEERYKSYAADHPDLAAEFQRWLSGTLPDGWDNGLPTLTAGGGPLATRQASGLALQAIAAALPNLVGGSADLGGSTGTTLKQGGSFGPMSSGRQFHWGVREHGMAGILNGMAAHGGLRPFGSTFLVFSDYMKPAIRLAAIMRPAGDLHRDPRFHRRRGGRAHPPAGRASRDAAGHPQSRRAPAGRRRRDGRGLAGGDRTDQRAHAAGALPPEAAGAGAAAARIGGGRVAWRLYPARRAGREPAGDPHRHRLRAARRGGGGAPAAGRPGAGAGGLDALVGAVRGPAGGVPQRGAAAGREVPAGDRGGVPVRLAPLDHR